jgi:hypothetical protein
LHGQNDLQYMAAAAKDEREREAVGEFANCIGGGGLGI